MSGLRLVVRGNFECGQLAIYNLPEIGEKFLPPPAEWFLPLLHLIALARKSLLYLKLVYLISIANRGFSCSLS